MLYVAREPDTQFVQPFVVVVDAMVPPRVRPACAPTGRIHVPTPPTDCRRLASTTALSPRIGIIWYNWERSKTTRQAGSA